ncbi:hypothetical protein SISSUDRAFT_186229 [Sistotremastrum suecicum HHB10207 ss-3]|uniref:F-box domain-containing protein n=1 Tax=Sistotremastrum suecicum HHB10207 ss-3 TaxID=1314776 RepID=A0A166AFY9_9AGAM|nr:hypothetical protein SISSUDRAFT_186229 [Sistotremastrum suecicum HHB10207 ss-3]
MLSLPPELVIKSLEGLSVQDVVNVTQTCNSLRAIILSNKQCLLQTDNAFTLFDSLPRGSTPAGISADALYATAASSVALSKRLSCGIPLEARSHTLYDLSKFELTWDPTNNIYPFEFFLANDIIAFQSSSTIFIMKLTPSGVIEESVRVEMTPDRAYRIDYQISDEGKSLFIAALIMDHTELTQLVQIYEIPILSFGFGEVALIRAVGLPYTERPIVVIRDPYVAFNVHHDGMLELGVINFRENTGLIINVLDREFTAEDDENDFEMMAIVDLKLHPKEPALFIHDEFWGSKFFLIDIPNDMPVLTHSLLSAYELWTRRRSLPREKPFPYPFEDAQRTIPSGFRKISTHSHAFDTVAMNPRPSKDPGEESVGGAQRASDDSDSLSLTRVSFHLPQETREVENVLYPHGSTPNGTVVYGTHILAPGVYFTVADLDSDHAAMVPKFEDGHGHGSCWVQLTIPEYLDLPGPPPSRSERDINALYQDDPAPSLFNVGTGRLYVCHPKGLHVIQY